MSRYHSTSSRSAIASAALLSLALLAGCQSGSQENNLPTEPAVANATTNGNSGDAPTGDPLAELNSELTRVGDRVHFALDRYDLSPEAEATLQRQAALLQNVQVATITIEGHADERGTREYNLALGERRADTVRNYLIALGVAGERISVTSYGKERPECPETAESCWAQNRRGVTVVNQ